MPRAIFVDLEPTVIDEVNWQTNEKFIAYSRKSNLPMDPHICLLVRRSVCHSLKKAYTSIVPIGALVIKFLLKGKDGNIPRPLSSRTTYHRYKTDIKKI